MLKSLTIENFRCFQRFELQQLGRVNLLVGKNNSGKTSILEALNLLTSQAILEALREVMIGRGEYILKNESSSNREFDISHLFYGHKMIGIGSQFSIFGTCLNDHDRSEKITVSIEEEINSFKGSSELLLVIKYLESKEHGPIQLPLTFQRGLPLDFQRLVRYLNLSDVKISRFITSSFLNTEETIELFDRIVLTPEEDLVIQALQTIEPTIQRIVPLASDKYKHSGLRNKDFGSRSGFVAKLSNEAQRIPLGIMGDGIQRMLGLALAIANARDGVLLVDEIDTGLHFSAMSDMWKLIWETAKRLNVQVFATTHNSDCWTSLAAIANANNPSEEGITIHRIEKENPGSITFTDQQIVMAAERGIEVR